jgi:hypothetical protein
MTRIAGSARIPFVAVLVLLSVATAFALDRRPAQSESVKFFDVPSQAAEFIGYSRSIRLTAEQLKTWDAALGSMAAPCCKDFPLSTCCCPCNLAKSSWGLANFLIARRGASAEQVRESVAGWLAFVNPAGFSGDVCVSGGCARRLSHGGCGGMDERNLLAAR